MDMAIQEWSNGLSGMTGNDIARGLEGWQEEWPPSLPEYRQACMGGNWQQRGGAYKKFQKALPKPKAKRETVDNQIKKIREALRK